jgi:hypothetical protein
MLRSKRGALYAVQCTRSRSRFPAGDNDGGGFGRAALYLSIVLFGAPLSLAAALATPLVWNLTVWIVHRRADYALN